MLTSEVERVQASGQSVAAPALGANASERTGGIDARGLWVARIVNALVDVQAVEAVAAIAGLALALEGAHFVHAVCVRMARISQQVRAFVDILTHIL